LVWCRTAAEDGWSVVLCSVLLLLFFTLKIYNEVESCLILSSLIVSPLIISSLLILSSSLANIDPTTFCAHAGFSCDIYHRLLPKLCQELAHRSPLNTTTCSRIDRSGRARRRSYEQRYGRRQTEVRIGSSPVTSLPTSGAARRSWNSLPPRMWGGGSGCCRVRRPSGNFGIGKRRSRREGKRRWSWRWCFPQENKVASEVGSEKGFTIYTLEISQGRG
jgi:hypothetical protein